jgi:hypothetical protein
MLTSVNGSKTALGAIAIALTMTLTPISGANAQQMCAKRTEVVNSLGVKYQESTTSVGLVNNGMMIEVLTSKTGTWTILMTRTNGVACVLAAGEAWEAIDNRIAEDPAT